MTTERKRTNRQTLIHSFVHSSYQRTLTIQKMIVVKLLLVVSSLVFATVNGNSLVGIRAGSSVPLHVGGDDGLILNGVDGVGSVLGQLLGLNANVGSDYLSTDILQRPRASLTVLVSRRPSGLEKFDAVASVACEKKLATLSPEKVLSEIGLFATKSMSIEDGASIRKLSSLPSQPGSDKHIDMILLHSEVDKLDNLYTELDRVYDGLALFQVVYLDTEECLHSGSRKLSNDDDGDLKFIKANPSSHRTGYEGASYTTMSLFSAAFAFILFYIFACVSWSSELDPILRSGLKTDPDFKRD